MKSLGEHLRTSREAKGLDLEQAGKDTKISIRYLQALENEDFSGFPGEAYITGFLRNYGDYLELDAQELLNMYNILKLQEQPIPVEQLLRSRSSFPKAAVVAIAIILALGGIGSGVYFIINRPANPKAEAQAPRAPVEYVMNEDSFEHRFFKGDSILIPVISETVEPAQIKLELVSLGEAVTINTPGGPIILDLAQEAYIDLDNTGISTLCVSAIDYAKNKANMGVLLRFELNAAFSFAAAMELESSEAVNIPGQSVSTVIFTSPNPYPFTLQSVFQGYCMFRWEVLMERDRRDRNERFFQRLDELNIQAQNGIRLWISNAQAARFVVIGGGRSVPVELGSSGEVVVADIRWVRDDDNRFRLIIVRLEV